jgi:hypothetical protein
MAALPFQVISIHGVPRSGTSWLGNLFNSHPQVAYRHQPLFAYRFKDRISLDSTPAAIRQFLEELYNVTDDPFILDLKRRRSLPEFWQQAHKAERPSHLVMKMVRYHHLIPHLMKSLPEIRIIGIVRHPCAVIHSWLQAPREFRPEWDPMQEWRYAPSKNAGRIEEFYGFEKWKEVANLFLELEQTHPDRFRLVRYEALVARPEEVTGRLFTFAGLTMHPQTLEFIRLSHSGHDPDPYAVRKRPDETQRWQHELDPRIAQAILTELRGTPLERFLT